MPEGIEWQVLVVDNNSQDQTRSVIEYQCHRYPKRFRYLFESQQGKSFALNSGIREARGEVLAFVDDDVEVDPNWLYNLTTALNNREWAGVGGRILPETGFTPPAWMETCGRYALGPLAIFDLGFEAGPLQEAPYGTNMAFRKDMFSKYGGFRIDLGPQPGSEIRNEDAEFGSRLLAAGERLWYEPSALVYHAIPQNRAQKGYFLRWWFDKGRADVRQDGIPRDSRWYAAGIPIYLFRRLSVWTIRWILSFNSRQRFTCKVKVWGIAGAIKECYLRHLAGTLVVDMSSLGVRAMPRNPRE